MNKFLLYICTIILSFFLNIVVPDAGELVKVSRVDSKDIVQLYFSIEGLQGFSSRQDKRRIDLIFDKTTQLETLEYFEPDDAIVKILPHQVGDNLILSIYFRYQPQKFEFVKSPDGKMVFEALLGNQYSTSYHNLSDRLKGLRLIDRRSPDSSNPFYLVPIQKTGSHSFHNLKILLRPM